MTSITKMKIAIVLAGVLLLVFSGNLFACHQGFWKGYALKGHSGDTPLPSRPKPNSALGYTLEPTSSTTAASAHATMNSANVTSDYTVTSTDCNARTANIQKFFNDSYQQIAEESAQGSGQHLEALASLTGCSTEQYGTFETVMNRNHRYVFADKDYDGSISNFFTVLNTDEDLKQCFGQQSPG